VPKKQLHIFAANASRQIKIFLWAIIRYVTTRSNCPCCGCGNGAIISRIKLVLLVKKCGNCGLIYRIPVRLIPAYYDSDYYKATTWYNDYKKKELGSYLEVKFRGGKWDYYDKLSLIKAVKDKGRVLDWGGAMGIMTYQLREIGYDPVVFEICTAFKPFHQDVLKLESISSFDEINKIPDRSFNIIFLHHVLEHIDNLKNAFSTFNRLLNEDGLLVCFIPNGGVGDPANVLDAAHINSFSASYFKDNLRRFGFNGVTFSTPYAFVESGPNADKTRASLGNELALFAWKQSTETPPAFKIWPYKLPNLEGSKRAQAGC
jgi:SAM-dependent methyltransferase